MSHIEVMETSDDFVHKSKDSKMLFIGEKIKKIMDPITSSVR